MATRDVTVRIKAEIGAFKRDMDAAAQAAKKAADETEKAGKKSRKAGVESQKAGRLAESGIGRMSQTAQKHQQAWDQVSNTMAVGGAAITGALVLSAKEAVTWQSAFAGVKKTVDGTPEQLGAVEDGLRGLARTLPSTHTEIAGVAEAAGQLGVAREDVVGFTKTMVDLGESTNLTAEDAATNIAQISNVMGTMDREGTKGVERFGSALVALGNDGASTEVEILNMAQRIAGAGASLGASEADVLALSNTLASMGVRAELGGGVATRVLLKMRTAVDEGGESVQAFADVAGTSAEEFATKFRESPMEALQLVAQGIDRTNDAGGNLTATLKDMGIKGTEEMQVMLALANSGDLLTDSLELGAQAWEANSALAEEASQRYATAESRVKIAWNNIKDAAISAGSVMLPVIASMADAVADLAGWFADLPAPAQTALTILGGFVGVAALAAGAFMKFGPSIISTVTGLRELRGATQRAQGPMTQLETRTRKLGSVAKTAATGLLLLATVGPMIGSMVSSGDVANIDKLNAALLGTGDAGAKLDEMFTGKGNFFDGLDVSGIENAFKIIGDPSISDNVDQTISKILTLGSRGSSNMEFVTKNFEQLDGVLATMAKSGNADAAADAYETLAAKAEAAGVPVEKLAEIFPQYAAALELAAATGESVDLGSLIEDFDGTNDSAQSAAEAIDNFYAAMVNAGMVVLGEREALRALEESFDSAAASIAENGKNLDTSTEKGRANQAALDGIASASLRAMEAQREAGASTSELAGTLAAGRDAFIENAMAAGMSEKAAGALADQLGLIPGSVYIEFQENTDSVAGKITEIHELVKSTPDGQITITENSPVVRAALENLGYVVTELPDGTIQVSETGTDKTGKKIDDEARKKRIAKINAEAVTGAAEKALSSTSSKKRTATIFATAVTGAAEAGMDRAARDRNATIWVRERVVSGGSQGATGRGGSGGITRATGGPVFGPGTETSDSIPAWLSTNEHVLSAREVRGLGGHSAVEDLRAMARSNNTPAFANGGAVGRAESKVKSTKRTYDRIDGNQANRLRKLAAKDQWEAAKEELKAAKASTKLSTESAKASRERAGKLSESRFDLSRDLRRGEITDSFKSGSGMSVVDRMFADSKSEDLSKGKRAGLRRDAFQLEGQLIGLGKQSDALKTKLEKATEARDRLLEVSKSVASGLRGEYSLGGVLSNLLSGDQKGPLNASSFVKSAQGKAAQIRKFGTMLGELRKQGYSEAIIQEIAALGTTEGMQVGNALLGATTGERTALNNAYKSMDYWSGQAGDEVTKSMYRGGVDAADGLVRGLEGKTKDVEDAFYKLGKNAEKSFKRSLGIKSPSRVMFGAGVNVGEGAELGILSKIGDVQSAAEQLMSPPSLTVPPSHEVTRYASAQAAPAGISAEAITAAVQAGMSGWQPMVQIDGRKFYGTMQQVNQQYGNRR